MMKLDGGIKAEKDSFGYLLTVDYSYEERVYVYVCLHISKVEKGGAVHRLCYISAPSQLIALVPATSPRRHKKMHYPNDSLSC